MSPLRMSSDQSIDSISSDDPTHFSTKLISLLSFLDKIDDKSDKEERVIRGASSSTHVPLTDESKTNSILIQEKKYIWDHWDEEIQNVFPQKKYIWDDDEMAMLDEETKCLWNDWEGTAEEDVDVQLIGENPKGAQGEIVKAEVSDKQSKRCPIDARQQLQLLKSMSVEIQTRADAMKKQLEQKTMEVEELHAIRVQNESDHALKVISVKQEWKQRIEDVRAEHDKVNNSWRSFTFLFNS